MPTPQTHKRVSPRTVAEEREDVNKALYFRLEKGERMASADYTSHGMVAVITLDNPPVNVLGSIVFGGGLKLAKCWRHRIALADARLGLPGAKRGIFPGAGCAQRWPRLAGLSQEEGPHG
jgi:enoyl-CoA hydratase/carnithine racemase